MKALSIRQPWAWLIIRPDLTTPEQRAAALAAGHIKTIENRNWATKRRGTTLIHAAKGMTKADYHDAAVFAYGLGVKVPPPDRLDRGGIIGSADIADCVDRSDSSWFLGRYGFVLANAKPLPFREFKGALGFFDVADGEEG